MNIDGVIVQKYRDSTSGGVPVLIIGEAKREYYFTLYDHDISHLWDSVRVGDHIKKDSSELDVYRTRNHQVAVFTIACDE